MVCRDRKCKSIVYFLGILVLWLLSDPLSGYGQGPVAVNVNGTETKTMAISVGKSITIQSPVAIKRVSVAAPNTADAVVLTPKQVYVSGKSAGVTTLTLWNTDDRIFAVIDLHVSPDTARLKAKLHEMFPMESDVRVSADNDSVILSGSVSSTAAVPQIVAAAQVYAPRDKDNKPRVVNLLRAGGVHQVMLEVRVSEMSRTVGKRMGINFNAISSTGRQFGISTLNNLTRPLGIQGVPYEQRLPISNDILTQSVLTQAFPTGPVGVSDNVDGILRFLGGGTSWTVFIDALKEQGLLKVLAEPTLIALSGTKANFLAGGEYPIPVPQVSGLATVITVTYKPFGVGLNFIPTVLDNGKINMEVSPEVSELDFSQAVALQGYIVPSITTRRVSTTVELADGQSFAIAGLLRDEVRENLKKFPFLGDLPVLGPLFRSSSFQKNESELVIVVTPHIVKPLDMTKQTLPTDQFVEPDDLEFYLLGRIQGGATGKSGTRSPVLGSEPAIEGKLGHLMP